MYHHGARVPLLLDRAASYESAGSFRLKVFDGPEDGTKKSPMSFWGAAKNLWTLWAAVVRSPGALLRATSGHAAASGRDDPLRTPAFF